MIHKISEIKLIIGGAAILIIILNNQKKEIIGKQDRPPFLKIILRENLREYKTFPPKNIIDDATPWEIINIMAPAILVDVKYNNAPITNPIWATEE